MNDKVVGFLLLDFWRTDRPTDLGIKAPSRSLTMVYFIYLEWLYWQIDFPPKYFRKGQEKVIKMLIKFTRCVALNFNQVLKIKNFVFDI